MTAHHVSVMAIQAEAGQALLPGSPDEAAQVFGRIADTARLALGDLRRLLGVLATEDDAGADGAREPQPGLDRLDDLVARVRGAGVAVDLTVEGTRDPPLPEGVDLSGVPHRAGGPHQRAQAWREPAWRWSGAPAPPARPRDLRRRARDAARTNGGHGLVGMRERADLLGGELTTGNRPGGGFAVERASAPVSVRVLVVDDQALVRTGFRMILDAQDDIEVVGEAGTARWRSCTHRRCSPTSCSWTSACR